MKSTSSVLFATLFLLVACGNENAAKVYQGYVEGEYVLIGPEESGRIEALMVRRGDQVEAGDPLFRMESEDACAQRAEAAARLAQAEAQLADRMRSGRRPQEIAVIDAQIQEARATLKEAELEFDRQQALAKREFASASKADAARATRDRAIARLEALEQELKVARLPARSDDITAAERNVEAAKASLELADWRLSRRIIKAPSTGLIDDTLRYPGESASPGAPVVSLLPPENRTIRFFIPQAKRALISLGDTVEANCDGCAESVKAEVSFIASEVEFTPPVIFSVESRDKLVFMVQARPGVGGMMLHPGQPIDVSVSERSSEAGQ